MVASQQDKTQVEVVIKEWNAAFIATDVGRLKNLWDKDYPQLLYIAEENNDAVRGNDAIGTYYNAIPEFVESIDFKLKETTIDAIGDMAYAYVEFLAKASIKGVDHEMTFEGRNTFILRKGGGQWKIIHYHESLSRDRSHETWGHIWS